MYREAFLKTVGPLCESERIYKRMYELRDDAAGRRAFLDTIPRELIERLSLFVPEVTPEWLSTMPEVDYLFPKDADVSIKKHYCYTPEFSHSHTYFEILYVYRGSCVNKVGGIPLHMRTGDVCFITPGETHALAVFDESIVVNVLVRTSTFQKTFFHIMEEGDILSDYLCRCLSGSGKNRYLLIHTGDDAFIQSQIAFLYLESYRSERYSAQMLNNGFMTLFYYILRNHIQNTEVEYQDRYNKRIIDILGYVRQHYAHISLESTAHEFHYNPSYLSRMLKQSVGKSFSEMLRECRMTEACRLLRLPDEKLSVEEIGIAVGYMHVEHFIRTFRQVFHKTPGEYRRDNQEDVFR
jgi:AraC-like DNA-binding protein/mannose-6-phosphate isomerase-like protein (cupin superfamily)